MIRAKRASLVLLIAFTGIGFAVVALASPRAIAPRDALVAAWDGGFGAWVEDLARDGREHLVLQPLAHHSVAAMHLVRHLRGSDRLMDRKLAAGLAGFLGPAAPAGTLDEMFEAEERRDRDGRSVTGPLDVQPVVGGVVRAKSGLAPARRGAMERLDAQSVVEDVVSAGARWCRHRERKAAGVAVLRKVVERTLDGEYWNSSSAAMQGLVCGCRVGARELLTRFSGYAAGKAPDHPSRPSLDQERHVAEALRAGSCEAIRGAGGNDVDGAAPETDEERARIQAFLGLARTVKQAVPLRVVAHAEYCPNEDVVTMEVENLSDATLLASFSVERLDPSGGWTEFSSDVLGAERYPRKAFTLRLAANAARSIRWNPRVSSNDRTWTEGSYRVVAHWLVDERAPGRQAIVAEFVVRSGPRCTSSGNSK